MPKQRRQRPGDSSQDICSSRAKPHDSNAECNTDISSELGYAKLFLGSSNGREEGNGSQESVVDDAALIYILLALPPSDHFVSVHHHLSFSSSKFSASAYFISFLPPSIGIYSSGPGAPLVT